MGAIDNMGGSKGGTGAPEGIVQKEEIAYEEEGSLRVGGNFTAYGN